MRPTINRAAPFAIAAVALGLSGCGGGGSSSSPAATPAITISVPGPTSTAHAQQSTTRPAKPPPPPYPVVTPAAGGTAPTSFVPAMRWRGATVAWVARSPAGVALLSFDQRLAGLQLHSGTVDAGAVGWHFGPGIEGPNRRHLVAAFNGGFRLSTGSGGFQSYGRVAVALRDGLASVVTYDDGTTDIGSWHKEVPANGANVVSVRQNLSLLIDHGAAASTLDCLSCWGATLGGVSAPARSALGITASGRLIWAGGEHLTVAELADALLGARVVRAVELDINPAWVAAYLYDHDHGSAPVAAIPIVPGQPGASGQFLTPYSRDFFAIVAR